ncbi:MAG: helix-turn-helix domain-containing protein [Oscillospiraceae bacterium]
MGSISVKKRPIPSDVLVRMSSVYLAAVLTICLVWIICRKKEGENMKMTLKAARINAGLTQEQVREKTGIARSTLTRWEHGKSSLQVRDLATLCELATGVPMECIKEK